MQLVLQCNDLKLLRPRLGGPLSIRREVHIFSIISWQTQLSIIICCPLLRISFCQGLRICNNLNIESNCDDYFARSCLELYFCILPGHLFCKSYDFFFYQLNKLLCQANCFQTSLFQTTFLQMPRFIFLLKKMPFQTPLYHLCKLNEMTFQTLPTFFLSMSIVFCCLFSLMSFTN